MVFCKHSLIHYNFTVSFEILKHHYCITLTHVRTSPVSMSQHLHWQLNKQHMACKRAMNDHEQMMHIDCHQQIEQNVHLSLRHIFFIVGRE